MNTALIIVDWQKEWINKDSPYYIGSNLAQETTQINKLIKWARHNNHKVIFMRHIETEEDAFKENTKGAELISSLHKNDNDVVIKKYRISSFYKTNLNNYLKDIDKLIIVGALANACVRSIASEAYDRDFKITLVQDCIKAFSKEALKYTLEDITFVRPEIKIKKYNEIIKN